MQCTQAGEGGSYHHAAHTRCVRPCGRPRSSRVMRQSRRRSGSNCCPKLALAVKRQTRRSKNSAVRRREVCHKAANKPSHNTPASHRGRRRCRVVLVSSKGTTGVNSWYSSQRCGTCGQGARCIGCLRAGRAATHPRASPDTPRIPRRRPAWRPATGAFYCCRSHHASASSGGMAKGTCQGGPAWSAWR